MPKIKTNRSAAKRFKVTGNSKLKRGKAFTNHNFTSKTKNRKRKLRKATLVHKTDLKNVKALLNI